MNLEQTLPGLLEVTLRRINLERRRGNYSVVNQLYQHCIDNAPTDKLKSHFSLKFARHLYKVTNEYDQAVELLEKTLSKNKGNVQLYMQLIDFAFHQKPINETTILNIFNKALKCSDIGDADKMLFSQRKIEFLEDFGSDIKMLIEATSYHEELAESITSSNKRSADESVYGGDEKRVRMDTDAYGASQAGFVAGSIPTMTQPSQALQSSDPNHAAYSYQNQQATWSNYQNAYGYPQSQWNQYQGYYPTA
ncbi:PRPF39 (predicted) [Pycnogonum litorale]